MTFFDIDATMTGRPLAKLCRLKTAFTLSRELYWALQSVLLIPAFAIALGLGDLAAALFSIAFIVLAQAFLIPLRLNDAGLRPWFGLLPFAVILMVFPLVYYPVSLNAVDHGFESGFILGVLCSAGILIVSAVWAGLLRTADATHLSQ